MLVILLLIGSTIADDFDEDDDDDDTKDDPMQSSLLANQIAELQKMQERDNAAALATENDGRKQVSHCCKCVLNVSLWGSQPVGGG